METNKTVTITAKLRNLRMSPRKVNMVARLLPGKTTLEARKELKFINKRASLVLIKLLNSALSNARVKGFKEEELLVDEILVGPGPTLKRVRFSSGGRIRRIMKRTSNIVFRLRSSSDGK